MTHSFGKDYWERHWEEPHPHEAGDAAAVEPNPYVRAETVGLKPGTALDAGCGTGAEAVWLATQGWQVTGADISATALAKASARAVEASVSGKATWVEADLTTWEPTELFDLVVTNYAHPTIPQLEFYQRIAGWVALTGTLLIVGHLHGSDSAGHGDHPPAEATVSLADITGGLDPARWRIDTAVVRTRAVSGSGGGAHRLNDVIVRATRAGTAVIRTSGAE